MGCNECTHPSCPNSLAMTGVSGCVECDSGTLVLDLMSAPKWRIVCNRLCFNYRGKKLMIGLGKFNDHQAASDAGRCDQCCCFSLSVCKSVSRVEMWDEIFRYSCIF